MLRLASRRSFVRHSTQPRYGTALLLSWPRSAASRLPNRLGGVLTLRAGIRSTVTPTEPSPESERWREWAGAAILFFLIYDECFGGPKARMTERGLVVELHEVLTENPLVAERLGTPFRSPPQFFLRDEHTESMDLADDDGKPVLRITCQIRGQRRNAMVYAQVHERMDEGEFEYLLVKFGDGEVLEVIDNRKS